MNWTFGILAGDDPYFIEKIISSIRNQTVKIQEYEIIIIGDPSRIKQFAAGDVILLEFDESIKQSWITKKKNLIAKRAKYENISLHHDYVVLDHEWYANFLKFGDDWDVAMTRIENMDGTRFRDWVTWNDGWGDKIIEFLSYKEKDKINQMYVSGTYFCIKKNFFINHPLDENLVWGQGEDVAWSKSIRNFWNYKLNFSSIARFLKYKNPWPAGPDPFHQDYVDLTETKDQLKN